MVKDDKSVEAYIKFLFFTTLRFVKYPVFQFYNLRHILASIHHKVKNKDEKTAFWSHIDLILTSF